MTSTSGLNESLSARRASEKLTIQKPIETDLDVIENGGLSPQLSVRTDDDACSEIIRIDQTPEERPTAFGRFVRTLQVCIFHFLFLIRSSFFLLLFNI